MSEHRRILQRPCRGKADSHPRPRRLTASRALATGWLALAALLAAGARPGWASEPSTDVIVYGGTPAGVAAAVTAARLGSTVVLIEPTAHVGGILSNGLTNADITNRKAIKGFFDEFVRRILAHYKSKFGADSAQVRACRGGFYFEPSAAELVFLRMIEEQDRVRLVMRQRLLQAVREGTTVLGLVCEARQKPGEPTTYRARVSIDASYEGDLAAMSGVACRVGRESRETYGELHAGRIFTYFGHNDPLDGSTGAGDRGVQAYCFRIFVTQDPANLVPITRPATYDPGDYKLLAADFQAGRVKKLGEAIQLYQMPNGKYEINSNHVTSPEKGPSESLDLAEENWGYPLADEAARAKIVARIRDHNQGLLWFLGHDPQVPPAIRADMQKYGLCRDEFADNGHWPGQVYVRETRRIVGRYNLTENDGRIVDFDRPRVQPTSIAIAEFPWDCHGVHKFSPEHPGSREGYFYVAHPPVQVPYAVLVPREIEGLLVPVCCSASHVGYQSLRVEPLYMALGQAAGEQAACVATRRHSDLADLPAEDLQIALVEQQAVITYYDDLPPDHPAFAGLQFLGARGLNPGFNATPDLKLNRRMAAERLQRIAAIMKLHWSPPQDDFEQPLRIINLDGWLRPLGWNVSNELNNKYGATELTMADFAQIVYQAIRGAPRAGRQPRR